MDREKKRIILVVSLVVALIVIIIIVIATTTEGFILNPFYDGSTKYGRIHSRMHHWEPRIYGKV